MNYTKIELLRKQLSIDIVSLDQKDADGNPTPAAIQAEENVNDLIAFASNEVRRRIGYEPVQSDESTKKYRLRVASETLYLKEPVRPSVDSNNRETGIAVKIGDGDTYRTDDTNPSVFLVDSNTIRLSYTYAPGTEFEITGRFGNYTSLSDMRYSDIQSATNAITYQYLFKSGITRSSTTGTTTVSTTGESWLSEQNINRMLSRYIKYTNLET